MARADRLLASFHVRPCTMADVPVVLQWFNDEAVHTAIEDEVRDRAGRKHFLHALVRSSPQKNSQGAFMVTCRNQPVGFIHLMWINWISRTAEVDLVIDPGSRSGIAGFMTIQKAGELVFERFNLNKLYGFIYETNTRSLVPLRRMLSIEATMVGAAIRDGAPTDVHIASVTAEGYHRFMDGLRHRRQAGSA